VSGINLVATYERIHSNSQYSVTYKNRLGGSPLYIEIHNDGSWSTYVSSPLTPDRTGFGSASLKKILPEVVTNDSTCMTRSMIEAQVQALTSFMIRNPRYPTLGAIQLYIHRLMQTHDSL